MTPELDWATIRYVSDPQTHSVGRYRLERILHEGPHSTVWLGRHEALHIEVAVKLFTGAGEAAFEAMRRESAALSRLRHPHAARILDAGTTGRGAQPWIALEYLDGPTLRAVLDRTHRLDPVRLWAALKQVASALAEAHRLGIVHGDLKPENVFLVRRGRGREEAVLADFSIARTDPADALGKRGGTPQYLAPEVVRGAAPTPASDVYALAVLAWEALAGRRLFDGEDSPSILFRQVHEEAPPLAAVVPVDPGFARIVKRALAKDPDARYPDAAALLRALQELDADALALYAMPEMQVGDPGDDLPTQPELAPDPLEGATRAFAPLCLDGSAGLRAEQRPRVWILGDDPATTSIATAAMLQRLGERADVEVIPQEESERRCEEMQRGATNCPSLVVFGGMAVLIEDPLLRLFRAQGEVSRLLVLSHTNNDLLGVAVNFVGVDGMFVIRGADWVEELDRAIDELLDRTRRLNRTYDALRFAVRTFSRKKADGSGTNPD